jgi:ribosomal protein S24E
LLSRRDVEVVVEHGAPFLFKNGDVSVRRMRSFLGNGESNVSVRIYHIYASSLLLLFWSLNLISAMFYDNLPF